MNDIKYISKKMAILSLLYFMAVVSYSTYIASKEISNSLFDYVSNFRVGGSASVLTLTLGVLPLLALVLPLLMDRLENDMIVIRIRRKRKLVYGHFLFFLFISVLFTLLMAACGIIGSLIATGDIDNLWGAKEGTIYFLLDNKAYFPLYIPHVKSVEVWAYLLSSRFLAVLFITTCIVFLKTILKKNIYVFFIAIILLGTDALFTERFSFFIGRVRIKMDTWLSPGEQLFNLGYLTLWILVFFYLSIKFYDKKEFY